MSLLVAVALVGASQPVVPFPPRREGAASGTAFAARVAAMSDHDRYAAARDEILAGNVPSFLRELVGVVRPAPPPPSPSS